LGGGGRGRAWWRIGGAGGFERRTICVVQDRDGVMRVLENIAYVIVVYAWHLTYIRGALSNNTQKKRFVSDVYQVLRDVIFYAETRWILMF
jgi:hypothetical protein